MRIESCQEVIKSEIKVGQEEIKNILQTKVEEIEEKIQKAKVNCRLQNFKKCLELLKIRPVKDNRLKDSEKHLEFLETCAAALISGTETVISHTISKLSIYQVKTSWAVSKTKFEIISQVNGYDSPTKSTQLVAVRGQSAEVLKDIEALH
ncbi:hypothetical protein NPIL_443221 [Nephila pilipes]|uniref:Uncharacterized protein n=1 Tax=Nephila pilipes TaxID=299642 RepID=A0A8X6URF4_NEPPI|nr:hypothetical protein NPIL_443221 [Nephila pilipes]